MRDRVYGSNAQVTDRRPNTEDTGSESGIRKRRGWRRFGALSG